MFNKILSILRHTSEIIAKNEDYNSVLSQIVETIAKNLDVEVCSVYVYDSKEDALILTATHGLNPDSVGKVSMKPGEGLTGTAFEEREILNISKPEQHPRFKYFKNTGEEKYNSFMAIPLSVGGTCVGVLAIQRKKADEFPPSILDMSKSIGAQLANLILNATILRSIGEKNVKFKTNGEKAETVSKGAMILRGSSVNRGIVIGKAFLFKSRDILSSVTHANYTDLNKELSSLDKALEITRKKTHDLEKKALTMISEADASIFYVHLLFLEDKYLLDEIKKEIINNKHTAEYSIKQVFGEYQKRFRHLKDNAFKDKIMDLKDVLMRLVENVKMIKNNSKEQEQHILPQEKLILVAQELLPSDLIRMPIDRIAGIVCEKGGLTAHIAILSKALNIPALLGVKELSKHVADEDELILDGHSELLHIRPADDVKEHFQELMQDSVQPIHDEATDSNIQETDSLTITEDGTPIQLRANVSLICETSLIKEYGAAGIGLYRSEFMYMIRDYLPTEEDQLRVFSKIIKAADGEKVTIRLLDTGGDKPLPYISFPKEDNPALGMRGIRLLLNKPEILKPHLKAILRAAVEGNVRMLLPMVSNASEVLKFKEILKSVKDDLKKASVKYADTITLGIMVEVPSAVFELKNLLELVDYISIGSNDLLQYTFAADRGNEKLNDYISSFNPAFIKIIGKIARRALDKDKEITICGELAGNPLAFPLIAGSGIRELSMAPRLIPQVREVASKFNIADCRKIFEKVEECADHNEVLAILHDEFKKRSLKS